MTHMTTQQSQFAVDTGIGPGDTRNTDANRLDTAQIMSGGIKIEQPLRYVELAIAIAVTILGA